LGCNGLQKLEWQSVIGIGVITFFIRIYRVWWQIMNKSEIVEKINSFSRWHYQFDLQGNLTPIFRQDHINRHNQRKRYFFDPLVRYFGGSLAGKRILDIGCNAGFWSLHAIQNGCDEVVGIDGRQMHVDQASFVFEVNQIAKEKYTFVTANIFEVDFRKFGSFDIVFCLGLLYHISKPIVLMEKIAQIANDLLVVDTNVIDRPGSFFNVLHEDIDNPHNAVDYSLTLRPSREAVLDIIKQFGYSVIVLKPQLDNYEGVSDYQYGSRRAFICAKQSNLDEFPAEVEEPAACISSRPTHKKSTLLKQSRNFVRNLFLRGK